MNLTGIIAIAGKPGLYKVISRNKSGLLVESLADGKKMPALATHKISALEDISMYTYDEDIKLSVVFDKIYAHTQGGEAIDPKSDGAALFSYFEQILPDFDKERVYPSDLKKLFTWYSLLLHAGIFAVAEQVDEPAAEEEAQESK
ncbi:MAG TPA: DUF5606 domain-containing protein [Luteibaculaceae bacterium]|nr:DUF5606 domain-containing protein [Luteibaculaceae bacterium]